MIFSFRIGRAFLAALAFLFLFNVTLRADDAASLYKAKCASCHGANGKGDTALGKQLGVRDFASPEVRKETSQELIEITAKGRKNMPGYGNSLKDSQIKDLVAYAAGLAKNK